jgi:hypothetical protein
MKSSGCVVFAALLFVSSPAAVTAQSSQGSSLFASARVAAFDFAVNAGLTVPDSTVFVREFDPADGMERKTVTPTKSSAAIREANEMATATQRGARTGFALDYLQCARACTANTRTPVIAVGDVTSAGKSGLGVLVILFEPPRQETGDRPSRTSATVIVERVGNMWRAVGFHPSFGELRTVLEPKRSGG